MHLLTTDTLGFQLAPKHFSPGGSIKDFVVAVQSKNILRYAKETTASFKRD